MDQTALTESTITRTIAPMSESLPSMRAFEGLRREAKLLLRCAAPGEPAAKAEALAGLLGEPFDWRWLMERAVENRVFPQLWLALSPLDPAPAPPEVMASLRRQFQESTLHNLA